MQVFGWAATPLAVSPRLRPCSLHKLRWSSSILPNRQHVVQQLERLQESWLAVECCRLGISAAPLFISFLKPLRSLGSPAFRGCFIDSQRYYCFGRSDAPSLWTRGCNSLCVLWNTTREIMRLCVFGWDNETLLFLCFVCAVARCCGRTCVRLTATALPKQMPASNQVRLGGGFVCAEVKCGSVCEQLPDWLPMSVGWPVLWQKT